MSNRDLGFNRVDKCDNKQSKTEEIKKFLIYIIIAIIAVTATYIFVRAKYDGTIGVPQSIFQGELPGEATSEDGYQNLVMNLKQIRSKIDSEFLGEIDETELVQRAIKGYVNGLKDDYSEYYTPEEWKNYKEELEGEFYGIGIYMTTNADKNVVVVSVIKGTPAEAAGLKADDIIYKVDDEEVLGIDTNFVSSKIKGPEKTKVKLTILRKGKEIVKTIERKKIHVVNVESKMLENKIGYIKIDSFDSHVYDDFSKAYKSLKEKGMKKLILDLRFNLGGDVRETIKVLDEFLPKKTVLYYTKDAQGREETVATSNDTEIKMPIVILGNGYSASASEIVISAMIDNKRAKFIGEKTYGKGVIQSVFETTNGGALKVTTSEYFRSNKEPINKIGIKPDIEVKIDENKKDSKGKVIDSQLNRAIKELNR